MCIFLTDARFLPWGIGIGRHGPAAEAAAATRVVPLLHTDSYDIGLAIERRPLSKWSNLDKVTRG